MARTNPSRAVIQRRRGARPTGLCTSAAPRRCGLALTLGVRPWTPRYLLSRVAWPRRATTPTHLRVPTSQDSGLFIFADQRHQRLLAAFRGPPQNFQPFVVYSDRVYFSFRTASNDARSWGFQFHARPISGLRWLQETEVLTQPSLEWACWLLAFMLTDLLPQLSPGAVHTGTLFDCAVAYIQTPDVPFKHRVIKLLTQLVTTPQEFSTRDPVRLDRLNDVFRAINTEVARAKASGQLFLTVRLQQLLELQATVHLARRLQTPGAIFPMTLWEAEDATSDAPLDPPINPSLPPPDSSMTHDYALADLKVLAQCLAVGARLPDELMCRAYLNSRGYTGQERNKYGCVRARANVVPLASFSCLSRMCMQVQLPQGERRSAAQLAVHVGARCPGREVGDADRAQLQQVSACSQPVQAQLVQPTRHDVRQAGGHERRRAAHSLRCACAFQPVRPAAPLRCLAASPCPLLTQRLRRVPTPAQALRIVRADGRHGL